MPRERQAAPGRDYLRAVMAETPTYWSDDRPPPAPTAQAPAAATATDRPITVWTPHGARQTTPESPESSWVIPAITILLVLGIIAIIAAVIW